MHMSNITIIGSWIANFFACGGAYESSKSHQKLNPMRMNILYCFANCYSVYYFLSTLQIPYLILQIVFLILSIKGIVNNYKKKHQNILKIE